jgi:hypothetical protein
MIPKLRNKLLAPKHALASAELLAPVANSGRVALDQYAQTRL